MRLFAIVCTFAGRCGFILTEALGVGIYSAAFKKNALSRAAYDEFIATTTLLNRVGAELGKDAAVHAMTDVTGFGLLGHALEISRGSGTAIVLKAQDLPFLAEAVSLAQRGFITGASGRNWKSYDACVTLPDATADWQRQLYCDPQTSGGLLVVCASERAAGLVDAIVAAGYPAARIIGEIPRPAHATDRAHPHHAEAVLPRVSTPTPASLRSSACVMASIPIGNLTL